MNKAEALAQVNFRLGRIDGAETQIVAEMDFAQRMLERRFLQYHLVPRDMYKEYICRVGSGGKTLPVGFVGLWPIAPVFVAKEATAQWLYEVPQSLFGDHQLRDDSVNFYIRGTKIEILPYVTTPYYVLLRCFVGAASPSTMADVDTNMWLRFFPELLIAQTVFSCAVAFERKSIQSPMKMLVEETFQGILASARADWRYDLVSSLFHDVVRRLPMGRWTFTNSWTETDQSMTGVTGETITWLTGDPLTWLTANQITWD